MTLYQPVVPRTFGVAALSLALVLVACASDGPAAPGGTFLPRLTGPPPSFAAAALEGTLVEDRGCLELTELDLSAEFASPSSGSVVLVLWPEGSQATSSDDGGIKVDAPALPSALTGQRLFVGGAFTSSLAEAEELVGEPIPPDCRVGLYWVATPVHS